MPWSLLLLFHSQGAFPHGDAFINASPTNLNNLICWSNLPPDQPNKKHFCLILTLFLFGETEVLYFLAYFTINWKALFDSICLSVHPQIGKKEWVRRNVLATSKMHANVPRLNTFSVCFSGCLCALSINYMKVTDHPHPHVSAHHGSALSTPS